AVRGLGAGARGGRAGWYKPSWIWRRTDRSALRRSAVSVRSWVRTQQPRTHACLLLGPPQHFPDSFRKIRWLARTLKIPDTVRKIVGPRRAGRRGAAL